MKSEHNLQFYEVSQSLKIGQLPIELVITKLTVCTQFPNIDKCVMYIEKKNILMFVKRGYLQFSQIFETI